MSDKNKNTAPAKAATPAKADKVAAAPKAPSAREIAAKARGFTLPLVLKCTVTGKEIRYTSVDYIAKVIERSPGKTLDSLRKTYVSREGRRINAAKNPKPAKAPKAAKPTASVKTEIAPATASANTTPAVVTS